MITNTERLALMRAGRDAYRSGQPSTACPYLLTEDDAQAAQGAAWVRGYVLARNIATEQRSGNTNDMTAPMTHPLP